MQTEQIETRSPEIKQWLERSQTTRLRRSEEIAKLSAPGFSPSPEYVTFLRKHYPMLFLALLSKMERFDSVVETSIRELRMAS